MFLTKLPNTGDSIFSVMTRLAGVHGALNLAQGFPDYQPDEALVELVAKALRDGHNQYAPMPGLADLRTQLSSKTKRVYGYQPNPDVEITVTAGATQAIFTAIAALVSNEQEVICFDPAYDCYAPAIRVQGARPIHIPMEFVGGVYRYNWDMLRARINTRTRMVIINNPHNPAGTVLEKSDLDRIAELLRNTEVAVLADEVYEHMVYDGKQHLSMLAHPELRERSIVVSSFGKTYHNTGWKIGYAIAPDSLMKEFRKVHQFNVFSVNSPMQHAYAKWLETDSSYLKLSEFYQAKRDLFLSSIKSSRFEFLPTAGTYFQLASYAKISDADDVEFAKTLVSEKGIAVIPVSPFLQSGENPKLIRFCFAKSNETLNKAAELICGI